MQAAHPPAAATTGCAHSFTFYRGFSLDLPVAAIKIRDYLFVFGPAYIIALLVGATIEVALNSRQAGGDQPVASALGATAPAQQKRFNVARALAGMFGYAPADGVVPLAVYLWVRSVTASFTWLGLLLTAALSWPLSFIRLGFVLVASGLLAVVVPHLVKVRHIEWDRAWAGEPENAPGDSRRARGAGKRKSSTGSKPVGNDAGSAAPLHVQWWRAVNARVSESSNVALLGAALGALLMALSPALLASQALVSGPAAYLWGALLATLSTLIPGTDAPLLSALNTRGLSDTLLMLLLALGIANFGLLKGLWRTAGQRTTLVYTTAALLLAVVGAWLLGASTPLNVLVP